MIRIARLAALALLPAAVLAQSASVMLPRAQVQADALSWTTAGNGIQTTIVLGDPAKPGTYVQRLRFPKGTRIMPHMHPDERVAVLLSGTLYFNYGDTFDEGALNRLAAGSTWTEPPNTAHFGWAKDEDAVVQVVGRGPSGTTAVK